MILIGKISIHAPLRGATPIPTFVPARLKISIHAPLRGATLLCTSGAHCLPISIHAPLRGATQAEGEKTGDPCDFNPRPSARGDYCFIRDIIFFHDFNPRPSARGDQIGFDQFLCRLISIHAPLRGATLKPRRFALPEDISIHAPLRGATSVRAVVAFGRDISIHAPLRGATASFYKPCPHIDNFNPRPSARGDEALKAMQQVIDISIHAPLRGATSQRQQRGQPLRNFNPRPSARGDFHL